jgi:hypothetical protein
MSGVANLRRVALLKRKSGRGPLQRLSDQRRSLALAGLAVGAVFSAAIFRRKRRGEEAEFESLASSAESPVASSGVPVAAAQPEAPTPAAPVDTGPPPVVEVPPPADEPELDDEAPINAAPTVKGAAEKATPEKNAASAASSAPVEPATGELSAQEASILSVLAQSGRGDDDRTALAVATSLERDSGDVADVLRKLSAEGVVSGDLYTAGGDKIWAVTERGVRRLGAQS